MKRRKENTFHKEQFSPFTREISKKAEMRW